MYSVMISCMIHWLEMIKYCIVLVYNSKGFSQSVQQGSTGHLHVRAGVRAACMVVCVMIIRVNVYVHPASPALTVKLVSNA